MFSQYEHTVKTAITFLQLLKVKINNSTVNETLQNHPDWPTLLCISDSLNKWHIPNAAGKIAIKDIDQLPTPFIAYTNDREAPLKVITLVTDNSVVFYQKDNSKTISEERAEFVKNWSGIYLIAEPNEYSGEIDYEAKKRNSFFNSLMPISSIVVIAILSFLLLYKNVGIYDDFITAIGVYLQYALLLTGIMVAALLLWYEIDKSNPLLQKVCTGIAKGNCNAILTGKQSKLFTWLSWSEVGFFYFTGGFLLLLFAGSTVVNAIAVVAWLNILALPYTVFSIYYQWRVAKQWCLLCLAVQALLSLGAINVIVNDFLIPISDLSISFVVNVVLLYLLPVLIWFAIKPYILKLQEAKNTKREYLRIKFNTEIFDTILKKQKAITVSVQGLGITLGNPAATNTLIKVCNPYCGPCAKAHPKIETLLEQHDNLQVKIIFNATNEEDSIMIKPVRHLLAIEEKNNEVVTKKALDDWYLSEKKDYDIFASKYPMNGELLKQGDKIEAMSKWCDAMQIYATPTIFINGYQLPDAYSIEDLQYFLLE